jgi:hypothetical protein
MSRRADYLQRLEAALKSGKKLEDFGIGAQGKTLRGRRKKA